MAALAAPEPAPAAALAPPPALTWRTGLGASLAASAADPGAWLLGLVAFLVRGGVLLLVLPIISIPSPVLLSMLFRGEIDSIGRDELRLVALLVGGVLSVIAILGVIASAWAEVHLAERLIGDPETDALRRGHHARRLPDAERRSLVWWVATIQAIAILPAILAVTYLVDGVVKSTTNEVMAPSDVHTPLFLRVLPELGPRILLVLGVILVVEALSSLASRRLMVAAWGLLPDASSPAPAPEPAAAGMTGDPAQDSPDPVRTRESRIAAGGIRRGLRHPARTAATAIAGWLLIAVTVALVMVASYFAWAAVRDVLTGATVSGGIAPILASAFFLVMFSAVWLGGLGLIGCAAAARAGLWTVDALR